MKKIVYFIIFIFSIFQSYNVLATEYIEENTIKKAILIEDYIKKHKVRIETFIKKYNINNLGYLNKSINELNESIIALDKIKNGEIEETKSKEIIQVIIKRIKNINENLKIKLNIEKLLFEKKLIQTKKNYSTLGIQIAKKIDAINLQIAKKIFEKKQILSLKESNIKHHLILLNKENKKLKSFSNIHFQSEREIKNSFIRILNNIKREINLMNSGLM